VNVPQPMNQMENPATVIVCPENFLFFTPERLSDKHLSRQQGRRRSVFHRRSKVLLPGILTNDE
jgi:hypothetical protein